MPPARTSQAHFGARARGWAAVYGLLGIVLGAYSRSAAACPQAEALRAPQVLALVPTLDTLRATPDPTCAGDLGALFTRSRFGVGVPEDPDVFERALRAIEALPPEAQAESLAVGMAPVLASSVRESLLQRWILPLQHDPSALARARTLALPATDTAGALTGAFTQYGPSLLRSFSVEGGSTLHLAAAHQEVALVLAYLASGEPDLIQLSLTLIEEAGIDSPELRTTLAAIPEQAPGYPQAQRILAARPAPAATLPPIAPPRVWPGQVPDAPLAQLGPLPRPNPPSPPGARLPDGLLLAGMGLVVVLVPVASRRRWTLPIAGLGLLFLGEATLRLAQPSPPDAPLFSFIPSSAALFQPVGDALESPGGSARATRIAPQPAPGTLRIGVLGESSVQGAHYLAEEAFSALLPAALASVDPTLPPIEALNLGIGGTTSAGVLAAGKEALQLGVSALVVYTGHNETSQFVRLGHYQHTPIWTLTARLWAQRSVLYRNLLAVLPQPAVAPTGGELRRETPPDRAEVARLQGLAVAHLTQNLGQLAATARDADVPLILCLPATNLPFAHVEPWPDPGPGDAADLDARLAAALSAARSGDAHAAREHLQDRIDLNASPREITRPVLEALAAIATTEGLPLVDIRADFAARSPDGFSYNGLFWDDLHPSRAGHAQIASAIAPTLAQALRQKQATSTQSRAAAGPKTPHP